MSVHQGLSEDEKAQVRHHMGYLGVDEVSTFALGTPAAVETQFIIEGAMNRVRLSALPNMRRILGILDTLENQMIGDFELAAVNKLDTIEINQDEQKQLVQRYDYWVAALGNILGCPRNPFDQRKFNPSGTSGINASVQH